MCGNLPLQAKAAQTHEFTAATPFLQLTYFSPHRRVSHPVLHHALCHGCSALPHGAEFGSVRSGGPHHCVEMLPSAQR